MYPRLDDQKAAFITQPSMFTAYTGTRIDVATQIHPIQAFMWLSAYVKKAIPGFTTTVCDMGVMDQRKAAAWQEYARFLLQERPRYVCFTVTTPIYYEAKLAGIIAKQILGPDVIVVHGGVHASHLFQESLTDSMCDVVVRGEGEISFAEICEGKLFKDILGIAYRADRRRQMYITVDEIITRLAHGESVYDVQLDAVVSHEPEVVANPRRPQMRRAQLDQLPFQDLELYQLWRYRNSRIIARNHPLLQVETSRGCPEQCNFCSAATDNYRIFSADRVVEEFRYYAAHGIREIRIIDDQFMASIPRAEEIAEKILMSGLRFDFNLAAGIRADKCSRKFLEHFKRAGLYQAAAGFESGDQESLDSIKKNLNLERSHEAMAMFREVGIEVIGFFMIGTPADTFRSMQATIDFAMRLMPDYGKVTICIPFPDTPLYWDYERRGLIAKPQRWDQYNIHRAADVYTHPNPDLTPAVLNSWYRKFYRQYYSNPRYLARQVSRSVRDGSFVWKAELAARTFFPRVFPTNTLDNLRAHYDTGPAPSA